MIARKRKTAKTTLPAIPPIPAKAPEVSESAQAALLQARSVKVTTAVEYEDAAIILRSLTLRESEIEARKKELWDPLAKLTKSVQLLFNPPLKVIAQAKTLVKDKMEAYLREQRDIQEAAQARADKEAEQVRQKLEARAEKAMDQGNLERAQVLTARAESVQAPTVELDVPAVSGVRVQEYWLFEITDEAEVPEQYRVVSEKLIREAIDQAKGRIEIDGVRIWSSLRPRG